MWRSIAQFPLSPGCRLPAAGWEESGSITSSVGPHRPGSLAELARRGGRRGERASTPRISPSRGQPLLLRRCLLLGRRLTGGGALDGALGALLGEELNSLLTGELLQGGGAGNGDVGDPVGDIGAEAAFLHNDVLLRHRIRAELRQRRDCGTGAALLRLRIDLQCLFQRDGEDLLLRTDGPG